jgi:RNA polymerase primary sigma factor
MRQLKINKSITPRSEQSLDKYLSEISRIPLVSTEEEVLLSQAIHAGGKKGKIAKDKLVKANLRFVVSVAKQYQNQGVPLPDLINEGNLGLITAADKFDETRGFKFISYAIWWIRQSILQAIAEYSNMVRRPLNQIMISNKIKNATHAFLQKYHREPSAEELSDIISLEIDKIEKAIQAESHVASIDAPITEDEGSTMADVLASSSDYATDLKVDYDSMCSDLMEVLTSILSERERIIVTQSFGIGCPERGMDAIGSDLGLTRERVRQIRERGLDKVRKSPKSRKLLKHLGA